MATRTIANGGGNWQDASTWVEGFVPTTSDDVVATATSGSVTIGAAANCKSADFTNYVGVLTHNAFTWTIVKSLTMVSGMTYTILASNASCRINFADAGTSNIIITAGKILPTIAFSTSVAGSWTIQDNFTAQTTTFTNGTFNSNNFNCSLLKIIISTSAIVNMGSGIWTISGLTSSVTIASGCTLNANTSTVILSNTGNTTKTISFGGKTLYNLTLNANVGVSHIYYFSTNVTVSNNFVVNGQNHIQIAAGGTITVSGTITLNSGSSTIITIDSDSPGTPGNIVGVAGTHNYVYLSITDNAISGGTYNASNSIDGTGNTGWTITNIPVIFQASGGFNSTYSGSSSLQSSGGKSGGQKSANVQSTGDAT